MIERKYIHILWQDDIKFFIRLLRMFNDPCCGFRNEEHVFLTPFESVYRQLAVFPNVELVQGGSSNLSLVKCLKRAAKESEYIFFHGSVRKKAMLILGRGVLNKMVLRTWGGDLLLPFSMVESHFGLKHHFSKWCTNTLNSRLIHQYSRLAAFGIANIVDEVELESIAPNVPQYRLNYPNLSFEASIQIGECIKYSPTTKHDDVLNILVGHSGFKGDNHIEILHSLKRFNNHGIRIHLVLSYGDPAYIDAVICYAKKEFDPQIVNIIDAYLPYREYLEFLSLIDIAIMDDVRSSALGNISVLVGMGKTIYVNPSSAYRKAMDREGYRYRLTSSLESESFEDFSSLEKNNDLRTACALAPKPACFGVKCWHEALDDLSSR